MEMSKNHFKNSPFSCFIHDMTTLHACAKDKCVIWQETCCTGTGLAGGGLLPPLLILSEACSSIKYGLNFKTELLTDCTSGNPTLHVEFARIFRKHSNICN